MLIIDENDNVIKKKTNGAEIVQCRAVTKPTKPTENRKLIAPLLANNKPKCLFPISESSHNSLVGDDDTPQIGSTATSEPVLHTPQIVIHLPTDEPLTNMLSHIQGLLVTGKTTARSSTFFLFIIFCILFPRTSGGVLPRRGIAHGIKEIILHDSFL
ncbi:hypothetical protein BpHYR1_052203 [Brachionus plicatilis]|uniref:Uncharacterized protein n=1 Tax=Brachionus plicatilis TaxID=10195 RepID=A0A3M7S402_BRAPC|nr:hypothetical protein BpHYR1_052203 [Brachionus plicatilis]